LFVKEKFHSTSSSQDHEWLVREKFPSLYGD
jgi:hypothetical protein